MMPDKQYYFLNNKFVALMSKTQLIRVYKNN